MRNLDEFTKIHSDELYEEINFFYEMNEKIKMNVIFDVGAGDKSIYFEHPGEVHYFEPFPKTYKELISKENNNSKYYYNNFGLSDKEEIIAYYDDAGSFVNREIGPSGVKSTFNGLNLPLKMANNYIIDKNIQEIDFVKLDIEGYELRALKGFSDKLSNVKIVQFEYGIGQADAGDNLREIVDYLKKYNFDGFSRMFFTKNYQLRPFSNFEDDWVWCNIVCYNKNYFITSPFSV
jgi:FkbM family methyltransferase